MSFYFKNNGDILIANHRKKVLVNPFEEIDPDERRAVVGDIIKSEPVQGDLSFLNYTVEPCVN